MSAITINQYYPDYRKMLNISIRFSPGSVGSSGLFVVHDKTDVYHSGYVFGNPYFPATEIYYIFGINHSRLVVASVDYFNDGTFTQRSIDTKQIPPIEPKKVLNTILCD
jgi:hypothetical protein